MVRCPGRAARTVGIGVLARSASPPVGYASAAAPRHAETVKAAAASLGQLAKASFHLAGAPWW